MIRLATDADLAAIERLVAEAYSAWIPRIGRRPAPMDDDYGALIAAGQVHVAGADTVLGLLVLIPEPDTLLLDNIAVAPSAQGQGIGRLLLGFAENEAKRLALPAIRLYTNEKMTENIALYLRHGFVETHRARQAGHNRVFMRKALR